jgi:hypothetical protein
MVCFPHPTDRLKTLQLEIFFGWFATTFFLLLFGYRKSWSKFQYCSRIYVRNWFTYKWTKSVAWLWRNQICEWTLKKKKIPLPTDPSRWNGGSGAGNEHIFKGGLRERKCFGNIQNFYSHFTKVIANGSVLVAL